MRARNGNISVTAGTDNSDLDFSYLNTRSGPNGVGYGVDYTNLGGRDHVVGTRFDDNFTLSSGMEYIEGGDGNDTVNYSRSTAGVRVDLNVTTQRGGHAEGDALVGIENVTGSNAKDILTGNAGRNVLLGLDGNDTMFGGGDNDTLDGGNNDDTLDGGTGSDTLLGGFGNDRLIAGTGNNVLDGGKGIDTADYSASTYGIMVALSGSGTLFEVVHPIDDLFEDLLLGAEENFIQHDTLTNIENLSGSAFTDILTGDEGVNTLLGNDGDDFISGAGGGDIEKGGKGNDHLGSVVIDSGLGVAGINDDTGSDQLFGEDGDDTLIGGMGADRMDGGADTDTVDYTWSPSAVAVNLATGTGSGLSDSWAAGDTYVSIEHVIGSQYADFILGSTNNDVIDGGYDNDTLFGNSGNDTLDGGEGNDTIEGSDDDDIMTGGAGNDTFVFRVAPNAAMFSPEAGDGNDIITDFHVGEDRLVIKGGSMADLDLHQDGANGVITYAGGTASITLENVNLADVMNHFQETIIFA
jgi:Ca2+-binding RTX toxin-like protein